MFSAFQSNAFQNNAFQIVAEVQHLSGSGVVRKYSKERERDVTERWIARAYKKRKDLDLAALEVVDIAGTKENITKLTQRKVKEKQQDININDLGDISSIEEKITNLVKKVNAIKKKKKQQQINARLLLLLTY